MTLTLVTSPFDVYHDTNGTPLDAGYIYIGTENQNPETNPISVYWDSALTQPAAQPVRTVNGYASNNGKPGVLYANSAYSINIRAIDGRLVASYPSSAGAAAASGGGSTQTAFKTPYDYNAPVGTELSVDNSSFADALADAAKASYDATGGDYTIKVDLAGKTWRLDSGFRMISARNPGMVIRNGTILVSGSGNIGLDLTDCSTLRVEDVTIIGDEDDPPDIGILYGRNSTKQAAPYITLINCRTEGSFNKFGRLRIASEVSTEIGCLWRNKSRALTARCDGCVDHMGALDDHCGGVTSPNATLPTAASGSLSNTLHFDSNSQAIRQAATYLTVTGVTKASTGGTGSNPVVTVAVGTLATSGLSNGDPVVFTLVTGMVELENQVFTVAAINTGADTFELSGADTTTYTTFLTGTCQNQTGPASLYAGCAQLRRTNFYSLVYGNHHATVDMDNGVPIRDFEVESLNERDPKSVFKFYLGSSSRTVQNFRARMLNYNQTIVDEVVTLDGTGPLVIDGGHIIVPNMSTVPTNGIFSDESIVSLRDFEIYVPKAAALNTAANYAAYVVRETAIDRNHKTMDYSVQQFAGNPTFKREDGGSVVATFQSNDAGASAAPYIDFDRDSASPADNDVLGKARFMGRNDAAETVEYASISVEALDVTDGTEDGRGLLSVMVNGTLTVVGRWASTGLTSVGSIVQTQQAATTAQLADITSAVNTTYKAPGKMVWNTDTSKPVWAVSALAGGVWKSADGATAHTPV